MTWTIGSLFTGTGALDRAVTAALAEILGTDEPPLLAWVADPGPGPSRLLAHHLPGVPNLGDITAIDWTRVPPVDVLTGGFPCQDVSAAGRRAGLRPGTRTGLWQVMARAVDILRPRLVVAENVRGLLSADAHSELEPCPWCVGDGERVPLRALGSVLGDLADLGYDAAWHGLPASDIGAPHGRFRVFILAWPAPDAPRDRRNQGRPEPARILR